MSPAVDSANNTRHGGQVSVSSESEEWVVLTDDGKKLKRLKQQNRTNKSSASKKEKNQKTDCVRPLEIIGTSSLSHVFRL